jgi:hypothetical protein
MAGYTPEGIGFISALYRTTHTVLMAKWYIPRPYIAATVSVARAFRGCDNMLTPMQNE